MEHSRVRTAAQYLAQDVKAVSYGRGKVVFSREIKLEGIALVSALENNPFAHILSYWKVSGLKKINSAYKLTCPFTLSAVSPRFRLLTEVVAQRDSLATMMISLYDRTAYHELKTRLTASGPLHRVDLMAWWLNASGLPISVSGAEAVAHVAEYADQLTVPLARLSLSAAQGSAEVPVELARHLEVLECGGNAEVLETLMDLGESSNLRRLRVAGCDDYQLRRIRSRLSVRELTLVDYISDVLDLTKSENSSGIPDRLAELTIESDKPFRVVGAGTCTALTHVHISGDEEGFDLQGLGEAPELKHLKLRLPELRSIAGLENCRLLESVDVEGCGELTSLKPLSGLPRLSKLNAGSSGVSELGDLHRCPNLKDVIAKDCPNLRSLAGLAGAPQLKEIYVQGSGVAMLGELHRCRQLRVVVFEDCASLASLDGLAGAPGLEFIAANRSSVAELGELHQCARLKSVSFGGCNYLTSLAGLAGAPNLTYVGVSRAAVKSLCGLNLCPQMAYLNCSRCRKLESLADLAGASCLKNISAERSGVIDVSGLSACPLLETVRLSGCKSLRSVDGLAGAPALRVVYVGGTGVTPGSELRNANNVNCLVFDEHEDYFDVFENSTPTLSFSDFSDF